MRYLTFSTAANPAQRLGVLRGTRVLDVVAASGGRLPGSLLSFIQSGDRVQQMLADLMAHERDAEIHSYAAESIHWHAPIPRPTKNVFCLGLNYRAHAIESARFRGKDPEIPTVPVIFSKAPTSVSGPFDDIAVDRDVTTKVDWEVELGVVIGTSGRDIRREDALQHVFGYTVINDLSARDLQISHQQWFKGKSLDGFCPMGPMIVSRDEFGDPQTKRLQLRVNGVTKQDSNTGDMIFPVDSIIEWLSKGLTLEPGDVIATGTPEGVGMGRNPQEYLNAGDEVETEIEGIGTLRNRITGGK